MHRTANLHTFAESSKTFCEESVGFGRSTASQGTEPLRQTPRNNCRCFSKRDCYANCVHSVKQDFQRGVQYHRSGNLKVAEQLYRDVLSKEPNHPDALHLLGVLAMQMKQPAVAANLINRAISINPGKGIYYGDFGKALYRCGKRDAAIQACRKAIELNPEDSEAHNTLGRVLNKAGKTAAAVAHFQNAIRINPRYAEAYFYIGRILEAQGQIEDAFENFESAANLDPTSINARIKLGVIQQKLGKINEAIATFKFIVERRPRHIEALIHLGLVYNDDGNRQEARKCFKTILEIDPNNARAHCFLGFISILDGDLDSSFVSFRHALTINPEFASAQYGMGTAYEEKGEVELAIKRYELALRLDSKLSAAQNNLELARKFLDGAEEPSKGLSFAYSRNSSNPRIILKYGTALWKSGRDDEAVKLLSKCLKAEPDCAEAHYFLGKALSSQSLEDEARRHFEKALEFEPSNAAYLAAEASLRTGYLTEGSKTASFGSKRIALHMHERYHYRILNPIFEEIPKEHRVILTPHVRDLLDFQPNVVVVSESQAALLRKRLPGAIFVWTRHGLISNNTTCYAARVSDYACLTSEENRKWHVRYGGNPRRGFWLTGYVQMDPLFRNETIPLPFSLPEKGKTVIYGPTWNEYLSSAPILGQRVVDLIRGNDKKISIIIKPHPVIFERYPKWVQIWRNLERTNENVFFVDDPMADVVPYLKAADLLVSDASSVIFQFLALNRPIILINNPNRFRTSHFDSKGIEWQWRDVANVIDRIEDLPSVVDRNLTNPENRLERRNHYRERLFGNLTDGRAAERIVAKIDQLILQ